MFKDTMNMIAGEVLYRDNFVPQYLEQQIMIMIVMIGSNPYAAHISAFFG